MTTRVSLREKRHSCEAEDVRSSQPMPPAPTSKTFVSGRRADNSGPKMAFACE